MENRQIQEIYTCLSEFKILQEIFGVGELQGEVYEVDTLKGYAD